MGEVEEAAAQAAFESLMEYHGDSSALDVAESALGATYNACATLHQYGCADDIIEDANADVELLNALLEEAMFAKPFSTRQLSSILLRHSRSQLQTMILVKSELLARITSTVMQQTLRIFTNMTSLFSTSMVHVLPTKRKKSCSKRMQNSGPRLVSTWEVKQSSLARVIPKGDSNSLLMVKLLPSEFSRNKVSPLNLPEEL